MSPISFLTQLTYTGPQTRQHQVIPEPELVSEVTHVAIAFMPSSTFNEKGASKWPLFTTVEEMRSKFAEGTKIMVAIGGWGDTGFSKASATVNTRRLFATNVKAMVDATGADGMLFPFPYKQFSNHKQGWTSIGNIPGTISNDESPCFLTTRQWKR